MESPQFALRVFGTLQWQRSSRKYSKSLNTLRQVAPTSLVEVTRISFADSVVLGSYYQGSSFVLELHGSTLAGPDERVHGARVQVVFTNAEVRKMPPKGAWFVQEEWAIASISTTVDGARFRLTAMCTRGYMDIECDDAELVVSEAQPESAVVLRKTAVEPEKAVQAKTG